MKQHHKCKDEPLRGPLFTRTSALKAGTFVATFALLAYPAFLAQDAEAKGKKPAAKPPAPIEMAKQAYAGDSWVRYADWPKTDWKEFNTLAATTSPAYAPPPKLDGPITGDPEKGAKLAFDRSRGGSCVACHVMGPKTPSLPGAVGPDLSTYATWQRDDQWIFNYIYDPRSVNPESVMPPWGTNKVFTVEEIKAWSLSSRA